VADQDDFKRQRFIEWLCTPKRERQPQTQEAFARDIFVNPDVLTRWKKDRTFVLAWENYYLSTVGSPERKQTILDTLYRTGTDADDPRHVAAAAKYMELVEGLKPQRLDVHLHRPAKDLTDDELNAIAARYAEQEQAARKQEREAS
jgi:hypothetical protein